MNTSISSSVENFEKGTSLAWALGALVLAAIALEGILQAKTTFGAQIAGIGFGSLALLALGATAWVKSGRRGIESAWISALIAFVLLMRAAFRIVDGSIPAQEGLIFAFTLVLISVVHRGSRALFWTIAFPAATTASLALVFVGEKSSLMGPSQTRATALAIFCGWVIAATIGSLRDAREIAVKASAEKSLLQQRLQGLRAELRTLGGDMKDLLGLGDRKETKIANASGADVASEKNYGVQTQTFSFGELRSLARELNAKYEEAFAESKIKFSVTDADKTSAPFAVRGDRDLVAHALNESLALAISAIGSSVGTVRITLSSDDEAATVLVEDNGRGLSEEMLAKIGEATKSTSRIEDIRKIVQSFEGQFDYQARLGVGSRVKIELARVDANAVGRAHLAAVKGESPKQNPNLQHG